MTQMQFDHEPRPEPVRADPRDRSGGELESPREGGLVVSLWLLAVTLAESELFLWLLERMYRA